jgi:hypothetical protein
LRDPQARKHAICGFSLGHEYRLVWAELGRTVGYEDAARLLRQPHFQIQVARPGEVRPEPRAQLLSVRVMTGETGTIASLVMGIYLAELEAQPPDLYNLLWQFICSRVCYRDRGPVHVRGQGRHVQLDWSSPLAVGKARLRPGLHEARSRTVNPRLRPGRTRLGPRSI